MPHITAPDILRRSDTAFSNTERVNAEILWRELATFILPNSSAFITTGSQGISGTGGIDTTVRLFDGTAIRANEDLASAIDSALTNSAIQWASLEFDSHILQQDRGPDGAVAWLEDANDKMFEAFSDSNFNTEKSSAYEMFTSLGSMVLFHEGVEPNEIGSFSGFQFKHISINELAWSENSLGIVDTVYRRLQLTAKQAVDRFGLENVSDAIRSDAEINPDTLHEFVHAIFPRDADQVDFLGIIVSELNRPFVSAYVERRTSEYAELSGYHEFPMYVVRFKKGPNEQIGRGRGHIALSDIRTLNTSIELLLEATEMGIKPPLITESENVPAGSDFSAGSQINVDDIDKLMQFQVGTNLPLTQMSLERLIQQIREAFFLDKILLPPRDKIGEMSAFETSKRIEEMQKIFGPTTGRLEHEWLKPLVLRSFRMMLRGGAFDPIPPLVAQALADSRSNDKLDINYINTLSRSQKFEQLTNIRQYVGSAQELAVATGSPEPIDRLDLDEIMKLNEEVLGVPPKIVRTDKQILEIRKNRAEQQQQAQATDTLIKSADAASKLK